MLLLLLLLLLSPYVPGAETDAPLVWLVWVEFRCRVVEEEGRRRAVEQAAEEVAWERKDGFFYIF